MVSFEATTSKHLLIFFEKKSFFFFISTFLPFRFWIDITFNLPFRLLIVIKHPFFALNAGQDAHNSGQNRHNSGRGAYFWGYQLQSAFRSAYYRLQSFISDQYIMASTLDFRSTHSKLSTLDTDLSW
uniref:Uncharacterized protein n=1 Tax=Rhizophagus irregularis (strain DAOM 181602 / DAOM 197198 / MUCL 43194) TaxID=747089 RepID=U9T4W1_RHIID